MNFCHGYIKQQNTAQTHVYYISNGVAVWLDDVACFVSVKEYSGESVERVGADGVASGSSAMMNGEFSASSSSSTRPMSYDSTRSSSAGAYAAGGGGGSVSSGSVAYSSAQTNNDAWNDRPASVHGGYAAEAGASYQYSTVIPASQRRAQSQHSNHVQEYVTARHLILSHCHL